MSDSQEATRDAITVFVKLFATFRLNRFPTRLMEFPAGSAVRDALSVLAIPEKEVAICMVNGHSKEIDHILSDGDTLSLFPPVGGG
ncbi:MoaD/ThiS family protein [Heliobacterium gestii]|uniref:MoaD/ThiS family protein n=1 Tax=Heliomicrobium gestii TaxID=2699 RepID=A0A845LLA4_HELGE|nr:MoaD/ThiS family protein [Heliomicrobium gestii]MBM7867770.1 molybdopterin converting factor small subunit [Heliomicrobium gestii]MZP44163.1 MoaD/ThiS family protein [Heliomicrobium gestii]